MIVSKFNPKLLKSTYRCVINQTLRHMSNGARRFTNLDINSKTGVAKLSMERPPVNSLNLELVNELITCLLQLEKEKARGLVITSDVDGVFTSGLDILEMYKPNQDRVKSYWSSLQDFWLHLYSSPYPTAAAITGHSPGGGCLIATSCDYRTMLKGPYTIGLNESQLGLAVPPWFVDTFRNVVPGRVSEMALISGKLFTVEEALKIELIDEVGANRDEVIAKALENVTALAKLNMIAMTQTKLTFRYSAITHLKDNREQDLRLFLKFVNSPEVQKSLEGYLEKLKSKKDKK